MAANKIAYRLRMYSPRSVDATEATLLTPAAGAAHSDEFKVASISGVSGYQPYLHDTIRGRNGRIDLLKRKLDVGTLSVTLIDKKVSTDNLTRWWSAFFGDVKGRPMGKLKVEIDECLDTSVASPTWSLFRTMELVGTKVVNKVDIQLSLRDRVETLKMKVFVNQPHSSLTYVAQPTILPIGFRNSDYGKLRKTLPLTGETVNAVLISAGVYQPTGERGVALDIASIGNDRNLFTTNLESALSPNTAITAFRVPAVNQLVNAFPDFDNNLRCHLKRLDTSAEGEFKVGLVSLWYEQKDGRGHARVVMVYLKALETTDGGYMAVPATGVSVEIALYVDGEISESRPLLINDVDPATYISDLCAGYFGALYRPPQTLPTGKSYGDVKRAVSTNGLASLVGTRPTMRLRVTKASTCIAEIERVCFENNWVPFLDKNGRLNIADLNLPATLAAVTTLSDTDIVEEEDVDWSHDPTQAIQLVKMTMYEERIISGSEFWQLADEVPTIAHPGLIEEIPHTLATLDLGTVDFGEEVLEIDGKGYRTMDGERLQDRVRAFRVRAALMAIGNQFAIPFGYGLITIPLRCRRTATVTALTQGSLVIVDADVVPDPGTHKRGGSQLCRVLEYSEDGPDIMLRCAFLSSATIAGAPTLGAPAQEANNTWSGVTTAVTVNAQSHPVEIRVAITDTATGTAPADTSLLWAVAGIQTVTGTFIIRGVDPGQRCWVQGRSFPRDATLAYAPSAWTAAGGTGRVDLAALPAPTTLAATKTDKTARLTWTNGADDVGTEILLMTPTSDPRVRVAIAPPGSTSWDLTHLEANTTYRAEVRHVVGQFYGTGDTEDFTTDNTATAPAAAAIVSLAFYTVT